MIWLALASASGVLTAFATSLESVLLQLLVLLFTQLVRHFVFLIWLWQPAGRGLKTAVMSL